MPRCVCIAKTTNLQCKKYAKKGSLFCSEHQKCIFTVRINPIITTSQKTDLIKQIKQKLDEIEMTSGKQNKINLSMQIYDLLTTPYGLIFIDNHANFKLTVKNKLIEFIEIEKLPRFIDYYEKIFGKYQPTKDPNRRPFDHTDFSFEEFRPFFERDF